MGRVPESRSTTQTNGAAKPKRQSTVGDMLRTMAVLLVPVLVIMVVFTRPPEQLPGSQPVDWQPVFDTAASEAKFPVVAPVNLPDGWVANHVSWDAGHDGADQRWVIGWLSPDQMSYEVEQSNTAAPVFVPKATRDGVVDGASTVLGQAWQRYRSSDDITRSLVRIDAATGAVTVVSADVSYEA